MGIHAPDSAVTSPACGDTIRIRVETDHDGYTVAAAGFTAHVPADIGVADTVRTIRAAHMRKAHGL
ncbi:hypothetical protein [Bifidobacterium castoris]|uniref:Uncharacterized protein n=1 Tax=Bifidobacterium castoris TaxID=2306972 RepID=A0A430FAC4_9BIFI|nr:hypothetical protein [Bifidobacterium castoris]RSX49758.1 hypothetical protein D2E22_0219 [Bifidobacterium castoris]